MRRKIALALVLVMILSLIPMASFAASANRVTNVVQAEADAGLQVDTSLIIENSKGDLGDGETFRLQLDNATWKSTLPTITDVGTPANEAYDVVRLSSSLIQLTVDFDTTLESEYEIALKPLINKVVAEGDARITVIPQDSALSGSTHTFAVAVDGDTVVNVSKTITFGPDENSEEMGNIIIDETVAGVLYNNSEVKLTLPRDFEWADGIVATVTGVGGFSGYSTTVTGNGERDLFVNLAGLDHSDTRGTLVIAGLRLYSESSRFGDVNMTTGGDLTKQTIKVATYADFGLTVEADGDIPEIVAGRFDGTVDGFELAALIIEENIADSLVRGRDVTVEFPDWVKIVDIDGDTVDAGYVGDNEFTFTPTGDSDDVLEYEFNIFVTVEADAEGDIVAEVTGRGLDNDYEVVLGTAIAPVTVEMEMTEVVIGASSQMLADITITENVAGALMETDTSDEEWLEILFDLEYLVLQSGVEVTVDEDSELEVDDVKRADNLLKIEIERESDEPAVIQITALFASLNRIPATGDYDVKVGGAALVNNNVIWNEDEVDEIEWFDTDYVWDAPMLRVVTEASQAQVDVAFTIGMNAYMVDGEVMAMDVAPFIADGRTMIPVRYLEDLFGMQPIWNATSRTVTVLYNGMVYEMAIGSAVLRVNGAPFMEMDAQAQIVDSRTFVPASRFARAMGIGYEWDAATQTVTFMK